jgi:hypothetical protein
MYSAFISFNQLKEYLSLLAENGLIQYAQETHTFRTTENHFLKLQNKIDEVAPISFISEAEGHKDGLWTTVLSAAVIKCCSDDIIDLLKK